MQFAVGTLRKTRKNVRRTSKHCSEVNGTRICEFVLNCPFTFAVQPVHRCFTGLRAPPETSSKETPPGLQHLSGDGRNLSHRASGERRAVTGGCWEKRGRNTKLIQARDSWCFTRRTGAMNCTGLRKQRPAPSSAFHR